MSLFVNHDIIDNQSFHLPFIHDSVITFENWYQLMLWEIIRPTIKVDPPRINCANNISFVCLIFHCHS